MLWTLFHEWKAINCPLAVCPFVLHVVSGQNCLRDLDLSVKILNHLNHFLGHWGARVHWAQFCSAVRVMGGPSDKLQWLTDPTKRSLPLDNWAPASRHHHYLPPPPPALACAGNTAIMAPCHLQPPIRGGINEPPQLRPVIPRPWMGFTQRSETVAAPESLGVPCLGADGPGSWLGRGESSNRNPLLIMAPI